MASFDIVIIDKHENETESFGSRFHEAAKTYKPLDHRRYTWGIRGDVGSEDIDKAWLCMAALVYWDEEVLGLLSKLSIKELRLLKTSLYEEGWAVSGEDVNEWRLLPQIRLLEKATRFFDGEPGEAYAYLKLLMEELDDYPA